MIIGTVLPLKEFDFKTEPSPDYQYRSIPGDEDLPEDKKNEYRRQAVYAEKTVEKMNQITKEMQDEFDGLKRRIGATPQADLVTK